MIAPYLLLCLSEAVMAEFSRLWENGPVFAQADHFRLSTDCVLLADFVNMTGQAKGIDLGCASGAIMLLLMTKNERISMTGLEILSSASALAEENMSANLLSERSRIICGDIREHRNLFKSGSFDFAVSNPPYYTPSSGFVSPKEDKATARSELSCSLDDICSAAAFLCRTGGSFFMVYKPERLAEALRVMSEKGLEPKRLRLVCADVSKPPSLILIEARRGGRPGLKFEASLFLNDQDGNESEEYRRIYHR